MTRIHKLKQIACLACLFVAAPAAAQLPFVVQAFQVEGAQRISEGTIYNYLPINIGDTVDEQLVRESIRAVYSTGFFQDIEFRRDGDTLTIAVLERPTIEDFTFSGNEDIEDEDLEGSLRDVGLAQGRIFDRSVLDDVTQFLTDEYYGRGKYAARVDANVEDLTDNRVRVAIEIEEGERAQIRQINIVGNTRFDDEEILDGFELTTGNFLSFIRDDNRYSKEALEGDIETLRSFYMDRGYGDFGLDGFPVVTISPDKQDIFITISVDEGNLYVISDVRLAGDMVVPEAELNALILSQPGQIFSQQLLTFSEEAMRIRLGQDGYSFAQIQAVPEFDEETQEVAVTFFVDPQSRVYVRRINFNGADNVNDEVFRREMRQFEGGYLSNNLIERSKVLLQRLPYVETVEYETVPVPGSPDLVDIEFAIEEGLPGQFGGSVGYSGTQGVILGGNFVHSNFMGTGNRVALNLTGGEYYKVYDVSFTDPYRNMDGLARSIQFSYQDIKQFTSVASQFSTTTLTAGLNWAYPITEYQQLRFGFAVQSAELLTSFYSSRQAREWVLSNGSQIDLGENSAIAATEIQSLELVGGWSFDTRNRVLFPDSGMRLSLNLQAALPGSEVEYYVARADFTKYFRLPGAWRVKINSELALGEGYGETTSPPPFRNFFGGGPGTVRGFKESWMGPIDSLGNPYGGNMLVANQFELILPTPGKLGNSTRISLFYDIGNVFSTGGVKFYDRTGMNEIDYDFDYDKLRQSVGLAVEWLAPLGLLRFSYASPLNEQDETGLLFGDQIERFQFSIGNAF
ncbi:outer membrane protein assembly factor BamA [Candidatus Rariloculus sp.]|uniref:outer membrane protein assembly factor BamA n=1 Tax=Candidatus Rariloculus sp. TaxID=3101265 RepID=UPI003D129DBC